MVTVEETISGADIEGSWNEIVDKSREVSDILKGIMEDEKVEAWDRWRPREKEDLDDEIREKTVDEAKIDEGPAEAEGKTAAEKAGEAADEAGKAVEDMKGGDRKSAKDRTRNSFLSLFSSVDVLMRKPVRYIQEFVYGNIISRTNRQYFDSQLISASLGSRNNLKKRVKGETNDKYILSISINDEETLERFKSNFLES